jgi:hypothetical protein
MSRRTRLTDAAPTPFSDALTTPSGDLDHGGEGSFLLGGGRGDHLDAEDSADLERR